MQAYRVHAGRKQGALERIEHEVHEPRAHEVAVRVHAVSLNYRDLMIVRGAYPISSENPPIAVADGAGEVIAVGSQVTRFKVGDHVARSLGADHTIHYRTVPEWQKEVLRIMNGRGADLVIEVGGNGTLGRSVASTRTGGTVALVGGVSGFAAELELMPLLVGAKRLIGILVGSRTMFKDLNRYVAAARIRPAVGRVFSFEEAREAFDYLESGSHFGKVVIKVRN